MNDKKADTFFESTCPFGAERIEAAAVYCSDGRFGEQVDELLQTALALPRYDRLAVPGGSACMAGHFPTHLEEKGVAEQLRFLVEAHHLQRVVLIAHEDCAYYTHKLRISPLQLESQQKIDMGKAIRRVQRFGRHLQVDAFFARKHHGKIRFERMQADGSHDAEPW